MIYDVNILLSEHINSNVINKNIYLFYKSPSTNIISIYQDYENDIYFLKDFKKMKNVAIFSAQELENYQKFQYK